MAGAHGRGRVLLTAAAVACAVGFPAVSLIVYGHGEAAVVSAMLAASIASAGPASALTPDGSVTLTEPEVACDRLANQFIVRWTVGNLPPITVGAIVPASGRLSADQRVPSTSTTVGLRLVLTDEEGVQTVIETTVELTGDCAPTTVRFATACANEVIVTVDTAGGPGGTVIRAWQPDGVELDGRVAVVTGAAAGIGQAIACRLAEAGARLVLADIAGCAQTVGMIGDAGGEATAVTVDLRNDADVRRLVDVAVQRCGGVQILVNNAGGGEPAARYPDAAAAQWSAVLDLNLRAPMLATQLALPALSANGGVVVNIASTAGLDHAAHGWPEYAVAKAGLIRFTTVMADLPRSANVRLTCIVPDWVRTARAEAELAVMTDAERAARPAPIPLPVLTDAVIELISNDTLSGHVLVLRPDDRPRPLADAASM